MGWANPWCWAEDTLCRFLTLPPWLQTLSSRLQGAGVTNTAKQKWSFLDRWSVLDVQQAETFGSAGPCPHRLAQPAHPPLPVVLGCALPKEDASGTVQQLVHACVCG